ncbi:unnamed protein product [Trichobilharzia regenti]|nr:unnamed protein product [Trichobilharzia regenti]
MVPNSDQKTKWQGSNQDVPPLWSPCFIGAEFSLTNKQMSSSHLASTALWFMPLFQSDQAKTQKSHSLTNITF